MTERRGKGENIIYFEHAGACRDAGRPGNWSRRELRHSFVSLMSDAGVPVTPLCYGVFVVATGKV